MNQPFRHILLDVGVVLLHLNYKHALEQALPLCDPARLAAGKSFLTLLNRSDIVDRYERGEISARQFYAHFVEQTGFRGGYDAFVDIWRSIFEENDPMLSFAAELAQHYPLYFLTNASDLHVPWIFDRFPRLLVFTGWACSCYLGETKPARAFYEKALRQLEINPADGLFIDDRPENIVGAEACGIRSLLYTDAPDTILRVRKALNFT